VTKKELFKRKTCQLRLSKTRGEGIEEGLNEEESREKRRVCSVKHVTGKVPEQGRGGTIDKHEISSSGGGGHENTKGEGECIVVGATKR